MDEKDKKIAELEAMIAELKKQLESKPQPEGEGEMGEMKKQMEDMGKKIAAYEESAKKAAEEKKLAEQKASFDRLLSEGKAVEAQRDAFMKGDAMKFAELAQSVNLSGQGSSVTPPSTNSTGDAQDQILKLAEEKVSKKEAANLGSAIALVLSENKDLREKYHANK